MNIHEMYGRQAEEAQKLREFYDYTMQLLRDLKSGSVQVEQLVLQPTGWELTDLPAVVIPDTEGDSE